MKPSFFWRGLRRANLPRFVRAKIVRPCVTLPEEAWVRVVLFAVEQGITNKAALERMVLR